MNMNYWAINKNFGFVAAAIVKQDEVSVFVQRIGGLKTELEDERSQGVELRKKVDTLQKYEQERNKLQKEVSFQFIICNLFKPNIFCSYEEYKI